MGKRGEGRKKWQLGQLGGFQHEGQREKEKIMYTTLWHCVAYTQIELYNNITNQNKHEHDDSEMLVFYFAHGFKERTITRTIIRRMIIATQVHFRVLFCRIFAFRRRFVPVCTCSAAPVTCDSMLSRISP